LVGCGDKSPTVEIANLMVEKAIRFFLKKPTGELTKADLEKVTSLSFGATQHNHLGPFVAVNENHTGERADDPPRTNPDRYEGAGEAPEFSGAESMAKRTD